MPSHEEHCLSTLKKLHCRFEKIHKWMDEPCHVMGRNHRVARHDPFETPRTAMEIFAKDYPQFAHLIGEAVLDHIMLDSKAGLNQEKTVITEATPETTKEELMKEAMRQLDEWMQQLESVKGKDLQGLEVEDLMNTERVLKKLAFLGRRRGKAEEALRENWVTRACGVPLHSPESLDEIVSTLESGRSLTIIIAPNVFFGGDSEETKFLVEEITEEARKHGWDIARLGNHRMVVCSPPLHLWNEAISKLDSVANASGKVRFVKFLPLVSKEDVRTIFNEVDSGNVIIFRCDELIRKKKTEEIRVLFIELLRGAIEQEKCRIIDIGLFRKAVISKDDQPARDLSGTADHTEEVEKAEECIEQKTEYQKQTGDLAPDPSYYDEEDEQSNESL